MAIINSLQDLENQKFVESTSVSGKPATAVANPDGSNIGADLLSQLQVINCLVPSSYDAIIPTFNATSTVWTFKLGATTISTITIYYTDSTKEVISSQGIVKT